MSKIAIIGVGSVGSSIAHRIITNNLAEQLLLYDVNSNRLWAEEKEILHCVSILESDTVVAKCDCRDCFKADLVILTASEKYRVGMRREDFLLSSARICSGIIEHLKSFQGVLLVVTNPVDMMTYLLCEHNLQNSNKIIGTGTVLDSYRLKAQLSDMNRDAWCVGEHGGAMFVPCAFFTSGREKRIENEIKKNNIISNKIMEIKGMTNWGITEICICLIDAIINDKKAIYPVSHMMTFPFMEEMACVGYPAKVGKEGIECNEKITLTKSEKEIIKIIGIEQQKKYDELEKVIQLC